MLTFSPPTRSLLGESSQLLWCALLRKVTCVVQECDQPPWSADRLMPKGCVIPVAIRDRRIEDNLVASNVYVNDAFDVLP